MSCSGLRQLPGSATRQWAGRQQMFLWGMVSVRARHAQEASELTKKSASWHLDTIWRRCSLVLFACTHMVLPPDPPYVLCINSVLTCCVHMLHALHTNKRVRSSSLMQCAYCGFSVLCNCFVLCIIAWFICVLLCGVCSVRAQISLRKRGRHLARFCKLCTGLHSVERSLYAQHTDCVATWCTTSVLCIVFCSAVCYSAWTVHRGWQPVCTASVLWITHILLLMFCIAIYSMVIIFYAQQCECIIDDVCFLSSEKW